MGVIRQRGRIWYVDYIVNGKRFKKRVGPFKKNAELYLADIELKINKNELGFLPKDSDLQKLFTEFLETCKTNGRSPATIKRYTAIIDNFKEYLVKSPHITKLSQVDAKLIDDYKTFRKSKGQEASPTTINIELTVLKSVWNRAIQWSYTNINPFRNVESIQVKKKFERFLTKEECKKLLENSDEWLYPIFYTFLNTGMRKQELMTLEWNDIDFDRRKIKIRVKVDWTPKTSEREIPMSDGLKDVLLKHKKKAIGNLVFHDGDGQMIAINRLRIELNKITTKAGFPEVTKLHTLRHTFASHCAMSGISMPTLKQFMGHTDIATTMIYAQFSPDHLSDEINKLDFQVKKSK